MTKEKKGHKSHEKISKSNFGREKEEEKKKNKRKEIYFEKVLTLATMTKKEAINLMRK